MTTVTVKTLLNSNVMEVVDNNNNRLILVWVVQPQVRRKKVPMKIVK